MIPSMAGLRGGCKDCSGESSCGSYHVYVISLGEGTSYDFYVGQTGKSVMARFRDNWSKYSSKGNGPRLIRRHFDGFRMDLVPRIAITCDTREAAEEQELLLAEELRSEGFKVRGPRRSH